MARTGYFPILDVLRFIAASCVVLAHSAVFFPAAAGTVHFGEFLRNAGYYAVIFFYNLSGFLITYLLLQEKRATGDIALTGFYKRRALRIWPLYYLIVLLSFFVFPFVIPGVGSAGSVIPGADGGRNGGWLMALLLYGCFLPNIAGLKGYYIATCFHTYTIGYEEQFYLFWPLLLRKLGKGVMLVLGGLFFLPVVLEMWHLWIIMHGLPLPGGVVGVVKAGLTFVNNSGIPAFIAGAVGAWLYLEKRAVVQRLMMKRWVSYGLVVVVVLLMTFGVPGGLGYVNLVSVVFALLILSMLEWKVGSRVGGVLAAGGRISYGIYIYHPVVLIAVASVMTGMGWMFPGKPVVTYLLYLVISFGLVLVLSYVSYRYYESFFLRKKVRLSPGVSRG